MSIITVSNVGHFFGAYTLFRNISFAIDRDKRIGLIGRNGSGKTTLLEIVAGRILSGEGEINKMKNCRIAYLNQSNEVFSGLSLWDFVLDSYDKFSELAEELHQQEKLVSTDSSESNLKKLNRLQEEFAAIDGYSLEFKAKLVLQQLGFDQSEFQRVVNTFSGGEKTRLQLASILLQPSDLLLLDEPTNHLDLKMRDWLIKFLNELTIPYIIVSHDRYFLDKTVTTIFALENKAITVYSGNYSQYEQQYRMRQEQLAKDYRAQQNYIAETEFFIRKNMAGQKTKQAQARLKTLNKIERIDKPGKEREFRLNFEAEDRSGNLVYSFDKLSFGFPEKTLAKSISGNIFYQDRLAILGDNGSGKTTFLQLLTGERSPLSGRMQKGAGLSIGYYDQLHLSLNNSLTVRETINYEHLDWDNHQTLSYLAKFGFIGDELEKRVSILSGGERARLYLALLIARKPNVLIMDEPTNHLDTYLISSLERALEDFSGTLIFVSHDRYFIENVATRFWVFKNETIVETPAWEELLLQEEKKQQKEKTERPTNNTKPKKANPMLLELMLKEIEDNQRVISNKSRELDSLVEKYLDQELMRDAERVKTLNSQISELKVSIADLQEKVCSKEEEYLNSLY